MKPTRLAALAIVASLGLTGPAFARMDVDYLGGLLGGVAGSAVGGTLDTAVEVADVADDDAVEARSERCVEDQRTIVHDLRIADVLHQLAFDTPDRRITAPASLDWAASFGSPIGQPAPKVDPHS